MQAAWLAEVEPSAFATFVQQYWQALRGLNDTLPTSPPEGVGELVAQPWPASFAVNQEVGFAAFRWHPSLDMRAEAFIVKPASSKHRVGLRLTSPGPDAVPAPTWWTETLGQSSTETEACFPDFLELAGILAAGGEIATTSAEALATANDARQEADYYRQLSEDQAEEIRQLRARTKDFFQEKLRLFEQPAVPITEEVDEVADLADLPAWAEANKERIEVLPRALAGAKKSRYSNPAAIFKALEFLAGPYRELRLSRMNRAAYQSSLAASGLQLSGSAGISVAGSQGEAYYVTHDGRRRFLDQHLGKGGGRDERYCLRVYFFWHDDSGKAVVGWLPSHLKNSLT